MPSPQGVLKGIIPVQYRIAPDRSTGRAFVGCLVGVVCFNDDVDGLVLMDIM